MHPMHRDNLLGRYLMATGHEIQRGRAWYEKARAECERMSAEYDVALDRVAAVLAITSPDAKLVQNVRWTEAILKARAMGTPLCDLDKAGRYPADQLPKVRMALDQRRPNPGIFASGPKVSAFFRAIMGDTDCLVIDRWAAFAAGESKAKVPNAGTRRAIERAYREAATMCGESVRDFQAIVWIQARESTPRSDGRLHRHFDF